MSNPVPFREIDHERAADGTFALKGATLARPGQLDDLASQAAAVHEEFLEPDEAMASDEEVLEAFTAALAEDDRDAGGAALVEMAERHLDEELNAAMAAVPGETPLYFMGIRYGPAVTVHYGTAREIVTWAKAGEAAGGGLVVRVESDSASRHVLACDFGKNLRFLPPTVSPPGEPAALGYVPTNEVDDADLADEWL